MRQVVTESLAQLREAATLGDPRIRWLKQYLPDFMFEESVLLLAGLGLGGLAFALAAKDTVSNLFGTLTIVLDRPFQVGDWVIVGGSTEGTVERVGFRSTRLRVAASSLDVLLYVFHETPDWATELRERHRLMLDILRLARRIGVDFAFPTQTVMFERGDGTDEEPEAALDPATATAQARLGRKRARELVEAGMGGLGVVPPPVELDVRAEENRGESGGE